MDENVVSTAQDSYSEPEQEVNTSSPEPSVEEASQETSSESSTIASADTEDGGMSLVKDPVTGKVSLKFGEDTSDTQEQNEGNTGDSGLNEAQPFGTDNINIGQQNVQDLPKYNLDEFSNALANGYVDANRVPQEYQAQYADYRIRQALAERQAQVQRQMQQEAYNRQQIEARMSPENRVQANKDFYRALEEEAGNAALKDLGMTQEEYDDSEYLDDGDQIKQDFENAKAWHKERLRNEMQARYQQEQAYKAQQQNIYNDISSFVDAERAKEPNFDAIDKTLATRYQTLPHQQGAKIEAALNALKSGNINQQGVQIIQQYYQDCRKEFYARKNGLQSNGKATQRRVPPAVEQAGSGQQVERSYNPNYGNLRNAKNSDARKAWFDEYFKNKGW